MDDTQKQHERAVGEALVAALNLKRGTQYVFSKQQENPDLIYRDDDSEIGIEVVTCYYDVNDAKFKWQNARNLPNAPRRWSGIDFDNALVININEVIEDKCSKHYGRNCVLAISVSTSLTTFKDMERLLPDVKIPPKHQFIGIYLIGDFGVSSDSPTSHTIRQLFPDSA